MSGSWFRVEDLQRHAVDDPVARPYEQPVAQHGATSVIGSLFTVVHIRPGVFDGAVLVRVAHDGAVGDDHLADVVLAIE